jgi:hypothetical protein
MWCAKLRSNLGICAWRFIHMFLELDAQNGLRLYRFNVSAGLPIRQVATTTSVDYYIMRLVADLRVHHI